MIWKRENCPQDLQQREVGKDEDAFWFQVSPWIAAPVWIQGHITIILKTLSSVFRAKSTVKEMMSLTTLSGSWSTSASVALSSTGTSSQGWRWSPIRWHKIRKLRQPWICSWSDPPEEKSNCFKKSWNGKRHLRICLFSQYKLWYLFFSLWIQNLTCEGRHTSVFLSPRSDMHVKFQS